MIIVIIIITIIYICNKKGRRLSVCCFLPLFLPFSVWWFHAKNSWFAEDCLYLYWPQFPCFSLPNSEIYCARWSIAEGCSSGKSCSSLFFYLVQASRLFLYSLVIVSFISFGMAFLCNLFFVTAILVAPIYAYVCIFTYRFCSAHIYIHRYMHNFYMNKGLLCWNLITHLYM